MTDWLLQNSKVAGVALLAVLVFGLVLAMLYGIRFGRRHPAVAEAGGDGRPPGVAAVEGAVFGLFGLLMAFTFSGASDRFQTRKTLIRVEAQAAAIAWGHLEMLSPPARDSLRERFRQYLDLRIGAYDAVTVAEYEGDIVAAEVLGTEIVMAAADACKADRGDGVAEIIVPSVTAMTATALARKAASRNHPPQTIFWLLIALGLSAAFMIGMAMAPAKQRSWIHIIAFGGIIGATIYVTIDIELPRVGFIRVDAADRLLDEVRASWDEPVQ